MTGADTVKLPAFASVSPLRVAIVEDAANIRERLVRLIIESGGMKVVGEADTEARAINICRFTSPDALILDMQLSQGSGLGVLRTMGYATASQKPAIIVLTNFPSPAVERAARALGASWFLDKSREFNSLPGLLRNVAAQSAAARTLDSAQQAVPNLLVAPDAPSSPELPGPQGS